MVCGRPQVLAEGDDIDVGGADVVEGALDLGVGFTEAQYQAGLGPRARGMPLGEREHAERLRVTRARIAHAMGQPFDGFQILRVGDETRVEHAGDLLEVAGEVRRQRFHRRVRRACMNRANARGIVRGATIGQVIAIDRSQHHVFQSHQDHRIGHVAWLGMVQPAVGVARADRAEFARARADFAHQHQGGGAAAPAFTDVRALGFDADGVQLVAAHDFAHFLEVLAARHAHAQPRWLAIDITDVAFGIRPNSILDCAHAVGGHVFVAACGYGNRFAVGLGFSFAGWRIASTLEQRQLVGHAVPALGSL